MFVVTLRKSGITVAVIADGNCDLRTTARFARFDRVDRSIRADLPGTSANRHRYRLDVIRARRHERRKMSGLVRAERETRVKGDRPAALARLRFE